VSEVVRVNPTDSRAGMLEACLPAPCRAVAEAAVRHCTSPRMRWPRANSIAASFTRTRAEARDRVLPRRLGSGRSHTRGAEATPLVEHSKLCGPEVMPPTSEPPKWPTSARHAAGMKRRLQWGSAPFGV
jgi:hypothetical protein